jgi:hypothetical protein
MTSSVGPLPQRLAPLSDLKTIISKGGKVVSLQRLRAPPVTGQAPCRRLDVLLSLLLIPPACGGVDAERQGRQHHDDADDSSCSGRKAHYGGQGADGEHW